MKLSQALKNELANNFSSTYKIVLLHEKTYSDVVACVKTYLEM